MQNQNLAVIQLAPLFPRFFSRIPVGCFTALFPALLVAVTVVSFVLV